MEIQQRLLRQVFIKGNWLNELSFTTGQSITIITKKGKLIV
ncbi:type I toxin-antitoxin system SymE family toxin [Gilliamella apicola]|nr:type I toxin-antitoxin system SymE family toxin [Gilliamella apicola]